MGQEAERLEQLWGGHFGDEYNNRTRSDFYPRRTFWKKITGTLKPATVLEVGCNACGNLKWLDGACEAFGVDVNKRALEAAKIAWPSLNLVYGRARELPFKDGLFDLTFTCGVLIHQPSESLRDVMSELVRCSRRYVLCMEYFNEKREEVPYRQQEGALFRDDFGGIYRRDFGLRVIDGGKLCKADGFDDITWWLLEKHQNTRRSV